VSRIDRIPPPPPQANPALFRWFTDLRQALALEAPVTATLSGGWQPFGAPYAVPQYWRRGDTLYLGGMAALGTLNVAMFTLPEGYRPPAEHLFEQVGVNASVPISVKPDGSVTLISGATGWVSLDGINFRIR